MASVKDKVKKVLSVALDDGRKVYVEATGLKITTRGKVRRPEDVMGGLSKGERRRIRKYLHRNGLGAMATQSVHPGSRDIR